MQIWREVLDALQDRLGLDTEFRWIPSHVHHTSGEDPFEDWVIRWNDAADRLACSTNRSRPCSFWRHYQSVQFYFLVAEDGGHPTGSQDELQEVESSEAEPDWLWVSWNDNLPINWKVRCLHGSFKVPGLFLVDLITWTCATESLEGTVRLVSDVEFVFLFLLDREFKFPFKLDGSQQFHVRKPDSLFQRPTFAMMLRPVQAAIDLLLDFFPHVVHRTSPQPNIALGLYKSFAGLRISIPDQMWQAALEQLRGFTETRAVRHSRDLARPVP